MLYEGQPSVGKKGEEKKNLKLFDKFYVRGVQKFKYLPSETHCLQAAQHKIQKLQTTVW